jgi:hypothetical protein
MRYWPPIWVIDPREKCVSCHIPVFNMDYQSINSANFDGLAATSRTTDSWRLLSSLSDLLMDGKSLFVLLSYGVSLSV